MDTQAFREYECKGMFHPLVILLKHSLNVLILP